MERVAFLIEATGERIGCLLNPASFAVRRQAGVQPRRSTGGPLTGVRLTDDPLLYTAGGSTEIELDLLFDVSLAGTAPTTGDVREFTRPLCQLAENAGAPDRSGRPPVVRFVWGKSWNVPGVVVAAAERFEQFDASGTPQRSWLRLRLLRVNEPPSAPAEDGAAVTGALVPPEAASPSDVVVHEIVGAGAEGGDPDAPPGGERLDELAARYYGSPDLWRLLADLNDVDDPLRLVPGTLLRVPPLASGGTQP